MSDVKRYDIYMHSDDVQFLRECLDGDYVRTSDYDTLLAQRDELLAVKANIERTEEWLRQQRDELVKALGHYRSAIWSALEYIQATAHGDNCYLSDHYDGDPGNRCNCGKESTAFYLAETLRTFKDAALSQAAK